MKQLAMLACLTVAVSLAFANTARAAVYYDSDLSTNVIMGTGLGNGHWTIVQDNGLELGLRAKIRYTDDYNVIGDGVYQYDTGLSSGTAAKWNFEFSAYTGVDYDLSRIAVLLSIDTDPSEGVSYTTMNIFDLYSDNEVGVFDTPESGGLKYTAETGATTLADYTLVQNSQNIGWLPGFDIYADATYDFMLTAIDLENDETLAQTTMQVIAGNGGAAVVPEPATLAVWSLFSGMGLILGWRRHRKV